MSIAIADVKSYLEKKIPGIRLKPIRDSLLLEDPNQLPEVALILKAAEAFKLDYLSSVTGADYLTYLESVYHLYSMEMKIGPLTLRVRLDRHNPRVPSLASVYRGAEYQERESYDLYGILYENHPDLRRIFLWEGFEGFPMRKDYVQEDSERLDQEALAWLDRHGVNVPGDLRQKAENPSKPPASTSSQETGEN